MELILLRDYFPGGTNGALYHQGKLVCHTIELPWLDNKPSYSCIPEGTYRVRLRYSLKHKAHLLLENVPGRKLILVHPANRAMQELKGCIAPVTKLTGMGKGSYSRKAFNKVMHLVLDAVDDALVFITIQSNTNEHSTKNGGAHTALL